MGGITNENEFRVFAIRRSGHHPIINWIVGQAKQADGNVAICFLGQVQRGENEISPFRIFDLLSATKKIQQESHSAYLPQYKDKLDQHALAKETVDGFTRKDYLIYNYEDYDISKNPCGYGEKHDEFVGTTKNLCSLLVLRDPFNLFASRLKLSDSAGYIRRGQRLWPIYAREFLGETNYLGDSKIAVDYNAWFRSEGYRAELCCKLGVPFSDVGLQEVPRHGDGSSFDKREYDGRAQEMKVLERWESYIGLPEYTALFDEKILDLAERTYPELTERFLNALRKTGKNRRRN